MTFGVRRVWSLPRSLRSLETQSSIHYRTPQHKIDTFTHSVRAPSEPSTLPVHTATRVIALVVILGLIALAVPSVMFYSDHGNLPKFLGGALTGDHKYFTKLSTIFDLFSSELSAAISRDPRYERYKMGEKERVLGSFHIDSAQSRPDSVGLYSSWASTQDRNLSIFSPDFRPVSGNDRHIRGVDGAVPPSQVDIAVTGIIRDARPSWEMSTAAKYLSKETLQAWRRAKQGRAQEVVGNSELQQHEFRRGELGDHAPRQEDAANGDEVFLPTVASSGTPRPVQILQNSSFKGLCGDAPIHLLPPFMQLGLLQQRAEHEEEVPRQLRNLRFVDVEPPADMDLRDLPWSLDAPRAWHAGSAGRARATHKRSAWNRGVREESSREEEGAASPRRTRSQRILPGTRLDGLAHPPSTHRALTPVRPVGRAASNVQLAVSSLRRGAAVSGEWDRGLSLPPPVPPTLPTRKHAPAMELSTAHARGRPELGLGAVGGPVQEVAPPPGMGRANTPEAGHGHGRSRGVRRHGMVPPPSIARDNTVLESAADVADELAVARDSYLQKCLEGGKLTRNRCARAWNVTSAIRDFPVPKDGSASQFFPGTMNHEHIRRTLLGGVNIDSWLLVKNAGCQGVPGRVMAENPSKDAPAEVNVKDGEEMLVQCMRDPGLSCHLAEARRAAAALPSIKLIQQVPKGVHNPLGIRYRQFESCALVGNGGALLRHKYGKHIDNHEVVVRFNLAPVPGNLSQHVGSKTTFMVLGHRPSAELCCEGATGSMSKEELARVQYILWTPPGEINNDIKSACHARSLGSQVHEITWPVLKRFSHAMRTFRRDAQRLGLGDELGSWTQMTSGAHAVFLFKNMCKSVDLYGFTTFPMEQDTPDQFWGRQHKSRSGTMAHDWAMESQLWRLMYLSGSMNICT